MEGIMGTPLVRNRPAGYGPASAFTLRRWHCPQGTLRACVPRSGVRFRAGVLSDRRPRNDTFWGAVFGLAFRAVVRKRRKSTQVGFNPAEGEQVEAPHQGK